MLQHFRLYCAGTVAEITPQGDADWGPQNGGPHKSAPSKVSAQPLFCPFPAGLHRSARRDAMAMLSLITPSGRKTIMTINGDMV